MRLAPPLELPEDLHPVLRSGTRLAIGMVVYLIVDALVLSFLLAKSQAILAMIVEDLLESVAPIAFLLTRDKKSEGPDQKFPYGHHRDVTLGAFSSALALLGFGLLLVTVSGRSLIQGEHPTIATVTVFGVHIWKGWLAIAWLVPTVALPLWLGRRMRAPAQQVNNRILHMAAELLSADWRSTVAAVVGMMGVAAGLWWADSAAAVIISVSIVADGVRSTQRIADLLLDRQATKIGSKETVGLVEQISREIANTDWAGEAQVRLRSHGQVFFGDVTIEIGECDVTGGQIEELEQRIGSLDWRLQEVLVAPVRVLRWGNENQTPPG